MIGERNMEKVGTIKTEVRKIGALIPFARNSRTHSDEQVAQIAASIREFGWTNPILIDGANGIIAGHGRLAAAFALAHRLATRNKISATVQIPERTGSDWADAA